MFTKFVKSIRANILVGLFLTIPVATTIVIFNFLFKLTTDWLVEKEIVKRTLESGTQIFLLRIVTLLAIVIAFYLVGLLTRNILGRRLYQIGDKLMARIPFIKGVYMPVRRLSESLFTQRNTLFKEVVLVQYPRKGLYSLAFLTAKVPSAIRQNMTDKDSEETCVSLFIPTTPNPTSGLLIMVPKSEVVPLTMAVTDALTFIMSAGAVSPGEEEESSPTLLDKLELWLKRGDKPTLKRTHATSTTT